MKRILLVGVAALAACAAGVTGASAQVYVRAPFVRVQTGPGVFVQAPFVNIAIPPVAPVYVVPPPSIYIPPAPPASRPIEILPTPAIAPQPTPVLQGPATSVPPPPPAPPVTPPLPSASRPLTLNQFAAGFKPRAGTFDVDLINPFTNQPTRVHFTLPEGTPKRVIVNADEVEFRYGLFQFVRIEFKSSGAQVVTRLGRN